MEMQYDNPQIRCDLIEKPALVLAPRSVRVGFSFINHEHNLSPAEILFQILPRIVADLGKPGAP